MRMSGAPKISLRVMYVDSARRSRHASERCVVQQYCFLSLLLLTWRQEGHHQDKRWTKVFGIALVQGKESSDFQLRPPRRSHRASNHWQVQVCKYTTHTHTHKASSVRWIVPHPHTQCISIPHRVRILIVLSRPNTFNLVWTSTRGWDREMTKTVSPTSTTPLATLDRREASWSPVV